MILNERNHPFVDVFPGSGYSLVNQGQINGRTTRKYRLENQSNESLANAISTIRNLLERNPHLCPTFLMWRLQAEIREKPYLTINDTAVSLSEEQDTHDIPSQYLDLYFSQDLLKEPVKCPQGHCLEQSSARLWLQHKTSCPVEPQHPIGDLQINKILQRCIIDFRIARKAKQQNRSLLGQTLESPYKIDMVAKLYFREASTTIISNNPLTVRITLSSERSITINTAVRRAPFEEVLQRISRLPNHSPIEVAHCTLEGVLLSDELNFARIKSDIDLQGMQPLRIIHNVRVLPQTPNLRMQEARGLSIPNPLSWLLGGLLDQVDHTIQDVINQGNNALMGLLIQTGEELRKAIDHFASVYKNSLDYTLDQVSTIVQNGYNQLVIMVDNFATKFEHALQEVALGAQQFANTLPFAHLQPQLKKAVPRCFVINDLALKSIISFQGNFPWSTIVEHGWIWDTTHKPSLVFDNTNCDCTDSTIQELTFEFPNNIFGNLPDKTKYYRAKGTLSVPWKDTGWLSNSIENAPFHITLVALPQIAGTVRPTFTSSVPNPNVIHQLKTIGPITCAGRGNTAHWRQYTPDQGFQFDTSTVKVAISGSNYYTVQQYTPECLGYTVHIGGNNKASGSATYTITVDQVQIANNIIQENTKPSFELKWNEAKALQPANGETLSRFTFIDCRGQQLTFYPPCFSQGILKVNPEINALVNGGWILKAEIPADLNAFMNASLS